MGNAIGSVLVHVFLSTALEPETVATVRNYEAQSVQLGGSFAGGHYRSRGRRESNLHQPYAARMEL